MYVERTRDEGEKKEENFSSSIRFFENHKSNTYKVGVFVA